MPYRFHTADVFTDRMFGGNQLAVLPDARGLDGDAMLAITREFNYSESVFVLPPDDPAHTRRLRIFTPGGEVPFAGHPTVGTAFVLAATGEVPLGPDGADIVFEEGVGPVRVRVRAEGGRPVHCQLTVAKLPEATPAPASREVLAAALSLDPSALADDAGWAPEVVSCGLPFLMVPLRDRAAVGRARVRHDLWERHLAGTPGSEVLVFSRDAEGPGNDLRARVFVPGLSVPEDPATGSACAALGGYLALRTPGARDGTLRWRVEQGVEMGRPSLLEVEADLRAGVVSSVRVGGASVLVSGGTMYV